MRESQTDNIEIRGDHIAYGGAKLDTRRAGIYARTRAQKKTTLPGSTHSDIEGTTDDRGDTNTAGSVEGGDIGCASKLPCAIFLPRSSLTWHIPELLDASSSFDPKNV